MERNDRRDFLRRVAVGAVAVGAGGAVTSSQAQEGPKVQRRKLGRTGAEVSILGLGLGSAFTTPFKDKPDETAVILERALLVHGINYWDTANGYGPSQQMIGPTLAKHRDQVFIVSKSGQRTYDGYRRELEKTLRELRTDHVDLFHCHDLKPTDDLDKMADGCVKAALQAKEEGLIKHFGCTGHTNADVIVKFMERFHPDVVLTVFPADGHGGPYETKILPLAREQQIGVIAMKTVRQAKQSDLKGSDLPRYAMSLEGISTAIVGLDSIAHLDENAKMAANFTPLTKEQMAAMGQHVRVALEGLVRPWDRPGYTDSSLV